MFGWVRPGDLLAVDGADGVVLVHPAPTEIERSTRTVTARSRHRCLGSRAVFTPVASRRAHLRGHARCSRSGTHHAFGCTTHRRAGGMRWVGSRYRGPDHDRSGCLRSADLGVRYVGMPRPAGQRRAGRWCSRRRGPRAFDVDEPTTMASTRSISTPATTRSARTAARRSAIPRRDESATTGRAVPAAAAGQIARSSLDRALAEPAPAIAIVVDPQAVAAAQLGEVILAMQLVLPPAARHDVRPEDAHDRAVLEAREQPAVVAHLTRLRRQQLRLREQAPHERAHELRLRLRRRRRARAAPSQSSPRAGDLRAAPRARPHRRRARRARARALRSAARRSRRGFCANIASCSRVAATSSAHTRAALTGALGGMPVSRR